MKIDNYNHLNYLVIFTAITSLVFSVAVNAAAGKVEFASGGAALQSADGNSKVLTKGMEINQGDTILTGTGRAQVKFTDGGYISFQPNTQFKVEEYNFNGKQDGTEKGFFRLVEGGLRAITGLVGRQNRPAYRMATPVATIGIRGSYYLAEFREKLKAHVGQGSIYIFNDQGDIILFAGQSAEVKSGEAPKYSDEEMTLGAKGPVGGQPQEGQEQQQSENENKDVFRVSEQYADDGVACLGADCGISSVVANLNGIGAVGYYVLDTTVANVGGGAGWTSKVDYASLYADFGKYTMGGYLNFSSAKSTGSTPVADYFSVNGDILTSGTFGLSGSGGGGVCPNYSCTINVIGLFSGAQAEKADIGYVIKGVDNGTSNTGQINGTAGIISQPIPRGQESCFSCLAQ